MTLLEKYSWETTHIAVIAGVVTTLMLGTYLFGSPRGQIPLALNGLPKPQKQSSSSSAVAVQPVPPARAAQVPSPQGRTGSPPSDLHVVTVGASDISNRYTLLSVERKPVPSKDDELIVRLHVESFAMAPLVSPFESDMLEIRSPGLPPITPSASFRTPLPSGSSLNQDVVFSIPQGLSLNDATLRIHYYFYQGEIPLSITAQTQNLSTYRKVP